MTEKDQFVILSPSQMRALIAAIKDPYERAAKALWRIDHPGEIETWEASAEHYPGSATYAKVRAVLKEIREPTEEMVIACGPGVGDFRSAHKKIWQTMIDALLA